MNFIHVGGHDGDDHIYSCVASYGWAGVVAEPVSWLYDDLVKVYAGHAVICENVAVSDVAGDVEMYTIDPEAYAGTPKPWPDYASTIDPALYEWHTQSGLGCLEASKCKSITVTAVTVADLCEKHSIGRLDLLSVDAEGCDGRIVRSLANCRVRPHVVVYEHLNMEQCEYDETRRAAKEMGYDRVTTFKRDTMVVRPGVDERFLKAFVSKLGGWWWNLDCKGYDPVKCVPRP